MILTDEQKQLIKDTYRSTTDLNDITRIVFEVKKEDSFDHT
jgi:hypothetical protein